MKTNEEYIEHWTDKEKGKLDLYMKRQRQTYNKIAADIYQNHLRDMTFNRNFRDNRDAEGEFKVL